MPRTTKKNAESANHAVAVGERICNLVPSRGITTDWTLGDAMAVGALTAVPCPAASTCARRGGRSATRVARDPAWAGPPATG
ncbi:hypothetical protein ACFQY4_19980 [Catellatospora bangladeshensis]|uniref:hypothetical protein n=1 Tax=Catellatospora bangladeshensis TaxID=310355 RepID=UPI00360A71E0